MGGWWARQSIEWKIPVAFVALLALLGGMHMVAAYRGFEENAEAAVRQRLSGASSQLALLISNSNQQRAAALRRVLDAPEFAPILNDTEDADRVLERLVQNPQSGTVVILDAELDEVASVGLTASPAALEGLRSAAGRALELSGQLQLSTLIAEEDGVRFWSALSARRADGSRIVLAQLRRLGEGEGGTSEALRSLIGETNVLLANADGRDASWVTLDGELTPAPDLGDSTTFAAGSYERSGTEYLANIAGVPGTPWVVATETPVSVARARAAEFIRTTLPIGIIVVLIGGTVAWLLGRHYTRPMREFTGAAAAFGHGDFSRRVEARRSDELGMMATAFNGMASEVQRSYAQLEDRVRHRTAELEAVNQELEAFSYSVSHDLRSPLRSIDGFSKALLEDYGPSLDATAQDYLGRLRGGAQRMGLLIDDLLLLARVSRQPITRTTVDLSGMAEQIGEDLTQADPQRNVDFVVEPGLATVGDYGLLEIAVRNLLDNAWKFTSKTERARVEFGRAGDGSFVVRDNGAGFSMDYSQQLFTPFQRLHSVQEFSGTGIGLATVHRVVTRHGGKTWAQAAVGRGASFHFTIDEGGHVDEIHTAG